MTKKDISKKPGVLKSLHSPSGISAATNSVLEALKVFPKPKDAHWTFNTQHARSKVTFRTAPGESLLPGF